MKSVLLAIALLSSSAAMAAPPAPPPGQAAPAKAPIDPERLALARKAVAAIIPPGTMEKIMKTSMGNMEEMMMKSMFDMKGSDLGVTGEGKEKTLREAMAEKDPHFEERMKITNRVMAEEMGRIFTRLEPRMVEGMARAYSRRFTVADLNEINRFFESPAGANFARQSFELMADPEMTSEMMSFMPELMKEMPAIGEKLKKATAHLPPPPKQEKEADEAAEAEEEETAEPVT